jgi:hypothetical protein
MGFRPFDRTRGVTSQSKGLEDVKTFKLSSTKLDLLQGRVQIAAEAIGNDVRVLSIEERPGRVWVELDVTVAGHPRRVREFHDSMKSSAWDGGGFEDLMFEVVVGGLWALGRKKWYDHRYPPVPNRNDAPSVAELRTAVEWKREQLLPDGDATGPVRVSIYRADEDTPSWTEEWPHWVKRSEALAYAQEHDYLFAPQDLPDE